MNKFKYYFILLLAGAAIISCSKKDDDDVVVEPPRDYAVQYKADNDSIEKYLKTNYITVSADFDVVITKIPAGGTQVSIWDQKLYPLEIRPVYNRDVNYKVYYLTLRKGSGESPCNTDRIYTSYSGNLLDGTSFDSSYGLGRSFELYGAGIIDGWGEIFPKFKTGIASAPSSNGAITYTDYGAGVMFLPSGLGYYNSVQGSIPAYSPLVFSFKLFDLQRLDHDLELVNGSTAIVPDGVPDYLEDVNGDGYVYNFKDTEKYPNPDASLVDDTDGDGLADFLDFDDDGDGFKTRFEITKPTGAPNTGISLYYPWNPIGDDISTPNINESETFGIPRRPTGELTNPALPESASNPRKFVEDDYKAAGRLRIHLDKTYPYKAN